MRWGTAERTLDRWQRVRPDARVLSVDVFDTALRRRVAPDRVVDASADALAAALGVDAVTVRAHRRRWRAAHDDRPRGEREWSLRRWLRVFAADEGLDADAVEARGLAVEAAIERETTSPDPEILALIRAARRRGWQVVAVSDTWHETEQLSALLTHHGVEVDAVFSSASLGHAKRDGAIFGPVERALGVASSAIVHVGDNWKGDLVRPALAGWRPHWRPFDGGPVVRGCADATRRALAAGRCRDADPLVRIGHELLAPMMLAHAVVARSIEARSGADVAVYLARDMAGFCEVRRAIDARVGEAAPVTYLRVSRRAVSLAHPGALLERAAGVAGRVGKSTVGGLLGGFDLGEALRLRLLDRAGLAPTDPWSDRARSAFAAACDAERVAIARARSVQADRLRAWLAQHVGSAQRVAMHDTGWAGTAQDAMAASDPTRAFDGIYLGVNGQGCASSARSTKRGLLWDDPAGLAPRSPWVRSAGCIRLVEVLLREPVPSVRRLVDAADGGVTVERTRGGDLTPGAVDAAQRLQRGLRAGVEARLDGVAASLRHGPTDAVDAWLDAVDRCFTAMLARPSAAFARAMLALPYEEGGTVESTSSLDVGGWRDGTTWWPGVLAARGVGAAAWLAEPAAAAVARVLQAKEQRG